MAHDVFISYSTENKVMADAVCHGLEARGIRCWIAPRDVKGGRDFAEAIIEAIGQARAVVLVFSSHANASPDVRREVQAAFNRGVVVIPLRIEEVQPSGSLEYYLAGRHWLDAVTPPLKARLQLLADNIEGLLRPGHEDAGQAAFDRSGGRNRERERRFGPNRTVFIVAGVAAALAVAGVAGVLALAPKPPGPQEQQTCNTYLNQNYQFQADSAAYAGADMTARQRAAEALIGSGRSGRSVYFASPPPPGIGDYGRLSHYWESFSDCINRKVLKYAEVSDTVSFPDDFWTNTRGLRRLFGRNWNGQGVGIDDFMSNFRELCQSYRRQRAAKGEDVSRLDCTS